MKRFIQGESRTQSTLLPELLGDYIDEMDAHFYVPEGPLSQACKCSFGVVTYHSQSACIASLRHPSIFSNSGL